MPPPADDDDAPRPRLPRNWPVRTDLPEQLARALIEEVRIGHDINVNMLLKHGLADNAYDKQTLGCALIAAVESRQPRMLRPLLNSGAQIDFASPVDGDTALNVALANQDWPMAQLLLVLGANPDRPDPMSQNTPLMVAIIEGDWIAASLLLRYDANPNLAHPVTGQTPWTLAHLLGHMAVLIEMLSRPVLHQTPALQLATRAPALAPQPTKATVQENGTNLPGAVDSTDGDGDGRTPVESASHIEQGAPVPDHAPVNGDSHCDDDVAASNSPSIATGLAPLHEP